MKKEVNITITEQVKGVVYAEAGSKINQTFIWKQEVEHIVPTQLSSLLGNNTFIGRKKELQEIDTLLNDSTTLLIKGIGGVGKSTLAKYYFHNQKSKYDYYGFFEGLELFIAKLKITLNLQQEKEEELFMEALVQLQRLNGKKLIIIDKVENVYDNEKKLEQILALEEYGYKILLISRFRVKNVETLSLKSLTPEDGLLLFTNHYKTDEIDKVNQIIKYLDYHALFVELVAKTINMEEDSSLDEIIEKFELGELSKIEYRDEDNGDKTLFNQNLTTLFKIQKKSLKDEYLLLLKQLSVLPSIDIELSFLNEIFDEKLKSRLNFLVSQGWLIGDGESYKLHQIIKEYLLANHLPTFEEIESQVDFFYKLIKNNDISIAITNKKNIIYLESISIIFRRINFKNEKVANFYVALGHIYYHLGLYNKVEILYDTALEIRKVLIGENHIDVSTIYNSLGNLFTAIGDYEKVENLYFQALEIRENLLGINNYFTSVSYNDLAIFYSKIELYDKAEPLYLKSLEIRIFLYGDEDIRTAKIYKNIANLYQLNGKNNKVENLLLKALNIEKKVLDSESIEMSHTYNSLAIFYESINELTKAESLYKDSLKIEEKLLGTTHPKISITYNNLAEVYKLIGNFDLAEIYYLKSLDIQERVLGDSHPITATTYNNIALLYHYKKNHNKAYFYMKKSYIVWKDLLEEDNKKVLLTKNAYLFFKEQVSKENISVVKVGRNSLCPCKSGLKYKKCCGKN